MKFVNRHASLIFYLVVMLIIALFDGAVIGSQLSMRILF